MKYTTCETVSAIAIHIRELGDGEKPNYTGTTKPVETLCGMRVGWDLPFPPGGASCRECRAVMNHRTAQGLPSAEEEGDG